ncbi:MAG: MEKHLA domain-containing protein [Cytophagaceae bacterium]
MQKLNPWENSRIQEHSLLLINSYQKITQEILFPGVTDVTELAYLLFHAPYVVVSHGTEASPIFNYGNLTALQQWKITWGEFTQLPSKYSAPEVSQEERNNLLQQAAEKGYIDNYEGVRIATDGSLFKIKNVLLWNVVDESGNNVGQAALFRNWNML